MKFNPLILIKCLLWFLTIQHTSARDVQNIGGIINSYHKVLDIKSGNDTITLDDVTGLNPNDVVLVIQMTGANKTAVDTSNVIADLGGSGRFEYLRIQEVLVGTNQLVMQSNVAKFFNENEKVQLVYVPVYEVAVVTSEITAMPWNGDKGGVVAMVANEKIELQADIDVEGLGFRGASPDSTADYNQCFSPENAKVHMYLDKNTTYSGTKGEGALAVTFTDIKGYGRAMNGGGAGVGLYAGGGGGGNVTTRQGGKGGRQIDYCELSPVIANKMQAEGGTESTSTVTTATYGGLLNNLKDYRIYMGGGGGVGTQNLSVGDTATAGGDGGGLILIITDTLDCNGFELITRGENVQGTATASGGGGGGGGAVVMYAEKYVDDTLNYDGSGGNGGSTQNSDNFYNGPGGGGSYGVLWISGDFDKNDTLFLEPFISGGSPLKQFIKLDPGAPGKVNGLDVSHGATEVMKYIPYSREADSTLIDQFQHFKFEYLPPLTGFLFNYVTRSQTICQGESAKALRGSNPKFGSGSYNITWQISLDGSNWKDTATVSDVELDPGVLFDTTYFRRIVEDVDQAIFDTSIAIRIDVHTAIADNLIEADTLVCQFTRADSITGNMYSGGVQNTYEFQWQSSIGGSPFTNILNDTLEKHMPDVGAVSIFYRRLMTSGVCESISDTVLIAVLTAIDSNNLVALQSVCKNSQAQIITGNDPTEGNGVYLFSWIKDDGNGWQDVSGQSGDTLEIGNISDTILYRRIVKSGPNDICIDTSNIHQVIALDSILGNQLAKKDSTCLLMSIDIVGVGALSKGNGNYSYSWRYRKSGESWDTLSNVSAAISTAPLDTLTFFQRIVFSGDNGGCYDTSDVIEIIVHPPISNNDFTEDNLDQCSDVDSIKILGQLPSGGNGNYTYSWQTSQDSSAWNILQTEQNLEVEENLSNGLYYIRRIVSSHDCMDTAVLRMNVIEAISGNILQPLDSVCFDQNFSITGNTALEGGNGIYGYQWVELDDGFNILGNAPGTYDQANYDISNVQDTVSFRRIVYSGEFNACADTSAVFTLKYIPLPELSFIESEDTVCNGDIKNLNISLTSTDSVNVYYQSAQDIKVVQNLAPSAALFELNTDAGFTLQIDSIIGENNCRATNLDMIEIVGIDYPEAILADDIAVCSDEVLLTANSGWDNAVWSSVDNVVFDDNTNNVNVRVTSNVYDNTEIVWTTTNWNCSNSDTIIVRFDLLPDTPIAGADQTHEIPEGITLEATPANAGVGYWTTNFEGITIADSLDANSGIGGMSVGEYLFTWNVINGVCAAQTDDVLITVLDLKLPEAFTPNGDNINDEFIIPGLEFLQDDGTVSIYIVNRWGQVVYQNEDYQNDWDGENQSGNELNQGTYFYIISFSNIETEFKGSIEIRR